MPTLSFKISSLQKNKINKIVDGIADDRGLSKGDALEYLSDFYNNELTKGAVHPDEYIPPNIQETIKSIRSMGCNYTQFTEDTFYCLEKFMKTKKKDILGVEPKEVLTLCTACLQRKADEVQKQLDKERRKESFKKIMDFAKQFMVITEKGFIATSYMCTCEAIDGDFSFSRDGKTLYCPLQDKDAVDIETICSTALNPSTNKPPCQYLITLDHLVQLSKDDLETMNLDLPEFTYQPPPVDHSKLYPENNKRKQVEPEYVIQDEPSLDKCPSCNTEMDTSLTERSCPNCGFKETFNPVDEMTREQLKDALDEKGIEYNNRGSTETLRELLLEEEE